MVLGHDRDADTGADGAEGDGGGRTDRDAEDRGEHDDEQHRPRTTDGQRDQQDVIGSIRPGTRWVGHDATAFSAR